MHIRSIKAADLPAVHHMVMALCAFHDHAGEITLATMKRDMLGDHPWIKVLVAEDAGALIGYAALLPLAKIANGWRGMDLNHMFVQAERRGQGVGRALIDASVTVAQDQGCSYMFVMTAEKNEPAQAAYLAYGFERWAKSGPRFRLDIA